MSEPSTPFGRWVGEALVIIVSILMAFGIDAWWQERQDRAEERETLSALETEFRASLAHMEQVLGRYARNKELIESLMRLTEAEIRALDQGEISELMMATCIPWTYDPTLGTLEALVSSGRLGILRHAPLRESLTTFANYVDDATEEEEFLVADARDVWTAEVGLGGPWTDSNTEIGITEESIEAPSFIPRASAEDLLRVRASRHFMGLVSRCHINHGYYVNDLRRLRDQIVLVQRRIDESP